MASQNLQIIGIDTGGTFTDLALHDHATGEIRISKVPTTPADPAIAVEQILESVDDGPAGGRIVHGTTIATNAMLESKGAKVAIVNTRGFRDLIEIGRTRRAGPGLFDTKFIKPRQLVPRSMRFEVDERVLADGSIYRPLSEDSLARALDALEAASPDVVIVCLLHSYRNPAHEVAVGKAIGKRLRDARIVLSSDVIPEYREYERLSTSVINGFVLPRMEHYLGRLGRYAETNRRALYVMGSNGGIMTAETAARYPVRTILSGPAGGVNGGLLACRQVNVPDFITCDMGGTSTDVSLVQALMPTMVRESAIAGLPLKVQQLDINTVGAGGGSIAWIDIDGGLRVGPQSAGAIPGPVCYGRGGAEPTVTDADLVLGRLGESTLLGGRMRIDLAGARASISTLAARARYGDEDRFAEGIIRLAVARMVSAIREISVERGHDPRHFTLVPLGGAGPLHAVEIAVELGIEQILVPPFAGNLSAVGLTGAHIRYDSAATHLAECMNDVHERVRPVIEGLTQNARAQLARDGFAPDKMQIDVTIDMRYRGQAFELAVPFDPGADDGVSLKQRFDHLYLKRYGFERAGHPIEIVTLRVAATGLVPEPRLTLGATVPGSEQQSSTRRLYWDGKWIDECRILRREHLHQGMTAKGPVVVEEFGSTTLVPPGWRMRIDEFGNLRVDRRLVE